MELRRLIGSSRPEFLQGYRFKIHAYNLMNPDNEFVRIDNHNNKSPHYHPVSDLVILFESTSMKKKQFIIQYDPSYSLGKMFDHFEQAAAGKKYLQPQNVIVCHDLTTIYSTITKNRLDLLTFLMAKQPKNIYQLAQLDKEEINEKVADNGSSVGKKAKVRPIALYEEIVFNFPVKEIVDLTNKRVTGPLRTKLKKKTELETKLKDAEPFKVEKAKLEKEEKVYNDKILEISDEIVKIDTRKALVVKDYQDLETPAAAGNAKAKYAAYLTTYNAKKKFDDWANALKTYGSNYDSNAIKIEFNGETFETTLDELDTLAGAVGHWLSKVKTSDFDANISKLTDDSGTQTTLKNEFKDLKESFLDKIKVSSSSNIGDTRTFFMMPDENFSDEVPVDPSDPDAASEIADIFPYGRFLDFVLDIAPTHKMEFINALNNTLSAEDKKDFNFGILPRSQTPLDEQKKIDYEIGKIKTFYLPEEDFSKCK
ncbi:2068_t:CDS:2 [Cetraspora pellucida]|uniref:2059_t:CDS:1 n=2 Tax=Cetraspora pellucida TaxID=1433469 RepID=A0ACA9JXV1_9GLOM|nr:2059_t:CDS:2 [Cetraspora pellucida]CAG8439712.1 2068_t:CDS:2 [Cetraspora pellucida]